MHNPNDVRNDSFSISRTWRKHGEICCQEKEGYEPSLQGWASRSSLRFKVQRLPTADLCYCRQWRNRNTTSTHSSANQAVFSAVTLFVQGKAISFRTSAMNHASVFFRFWYLKSSRNTFDCGSALRNRAGMEVKFSWCRRRFTT